MGKEKISHSNLHRTLTCTLNSMKEDGVALDMMTNAPCGHAVAQVMHSLISKMEGNGAVHLL